MHRSLLNRCLLFPTCSESLKNSQAKPGNVCSTLPVFTSILGKLAVWHDGSYDHRFCGLAFVNLFSFIGGVQRRSRKRKNRKHSRSLCWFAKHLRRWFTIHRSADILHGELRRDSHFFGFPDSQQMVNWWFGLAVWDTQKLMGFLFS